MLQKHKANIAKNKYEAEVAKWQEQIARLNTCIELTKTFKGTDTNDIMLKPDEALFFYVTDASLIAERTGRGHYAGVSQGVSIPIGHIGRYPVRYHVGASKGHFEQGQPYQAAVDTGTVYITNKRVVFAGSKQTRECNFDKLIGVQHDPAQGATTFSVSNRQKPTTIHYGPQVVGNFVFRLQLALAHYKATVPKLQSQLEAALAELEASKPAAPAGGQTTTSPAALSSGQGNGKTKPSHKKRWILGITLGLILLAAVSSHSSSNNTNTNTAATDTQTQANATDTSSAAPATQTQAQPAKSSTPATVLAFSGLVSGNASGSINVKSPKTVSSSDTYNAPSWTTQCILAPGSDNTNAWSANMAFSLNNNTWEIQISNGNNFGNPSTGRHPAVDQQNNRSNTGALLVYVASKQSIANDQSASDTNLYSYVTSGQNSDTATVTIDTSLKSGTLDLWETPFNSPSSQQFHITGTWSCAN